HRVCVTVLEHREANRVGSIAGARRFLIDDRSPAAAIEGGICILSPAFIHIISGAGGLRYPGCVRIPRHSAIRTLEDGCESVRGRVWKNRVNISGSVAIEGKSALIACGRIDFCPNSVGGLAREYS